MSFEIHVGQCQYAQHQLMNVATSFEFEHVDISVLLKEIEVYSGQRRMKYEFCQVIK